MPSSPPYGGPFSQGVQLNLPVWRCPLQTDWGLDIVILLLPEAQLRRYRVLEPVLAIVAKEARTASLDVLPHELRDDLGERLRVLLIQRDSENFEAHTILARLFTLVPSGCSLSPSGA